MIAWCRLFGKTVGKKIHYGICYKILALKSIATYTVYAIVRSGDVLAAQCKCDAEGGGMQTCCYPAVLCTLRSSREVKSIKESSFK